MYIYNREKNGELRVQPFYPLEEISIFIYIIKTNIVESGVKHQKSLYIIKKNTYKRGAMGLTGQRRSITTGKEYKS